MDTRPGSGKETSRVWIVAGLLLVALLLTAPPLVRRGAVVVAVSGWFAWEAVSIAWSADKALSLRRWIPWIITAAAGFALGFELGEKRCVMLMALVCSAFFLAGLWKEMRRGLSPTEAGYRFAGTLQPNGQGFNCAMLALSCAYLGTVGSLMPSLAILGVAAGVAGLALTRSRAVFWAAGGAAIVWAITAQPGSRLAWPLSVAIAIFASGFAISRFFVRTPGNAARGLSELVSLGRPQEHVYTLNGRIRIWKHLLPCHPRQWIAGSGFGAYWHASRIALLRRETGRSLASCQSTFLEILLRSGAIGAALFLATMVTALAAAFGPHREGAFLGSVLVFFLMEACVESTFAVPDLGSLFYFLLLGVLAAR